MPEFIWFGDKLCINAQDISFVAFDKCGVVRVGSMTAACPPSDVMLDDKQVQDLKRTLERITLSCPEPPGHTRRMGP